MDVAIIATDLALYFKSVQQQANSIHLKETDLTCPTMYTIMIYSPI